MAKLHMDKVTLTVKEVAEMIGLSTTTIYNMCASGQLPHTKARSRILFYRPTLEKWLAGIDINDVSLMQKLMEFNEKGELT